MSSPEKPSGVLVVDKPEGPTSHDIVQAARRSYATHQVGHAGTLDPMATGVLVVLIGEATKLSPYLTGQEKRYRASVRFGRATDTLDGQGRTTEQRSLLSGFLTRDALEAALAQERARTEQRPPLFSAIQVGGKRAHREARAGRELELPPRPVHVHELALLSFDESSVTLELVVDKGYYVRSLARDLGQALGVPAHLAALRRLASGALSLEHAVNFPLSEPPPAPLSLGAAVRLALACAELTDEGSARARQGKPLAAEHFVAPPGSELPHAWLAAGDRLIAIGERRDDAFRVLRGFADKEPLAVSR